MTLRFNLEDICWYDIVISGYLIYLINLFNVLKCIKCLSLVFLPHFLWVTSKLKMNSREKGKKKTLRL